MRPLLRLLCSFACVGFLSAQVAIVRSGSVELGGFVGASYGIGSYAVMGGGNVSYAATKFLLPYVEFSYFPSIERHLTGTIGGTSNSYSADYSLAATDVHGGVHIRIPVRESRFAPYGVIGVGRLGYSSSILNINYLDSSGTSHPIPGGVQSPGGGRVALNFGGGLRFYANPRYGFRVEVKGYKPFGEPAGGQLGYSNTFLKAEGGFFIQFH
jgi:hypothetical protein